VKEKPEINEHEAEELIKGMGRNATVVVHSDGLVRAIAIHSNPSDPTIQNPADELLLKMQERYRIVKKRK
jgi:hypothetical protein